MQKTIDAIAVRGVLVALIGAILALASPVAAEAKGDANGAQAEAALIAPGAGYSEPNGSQQVRSLQKQLVRAGERPGPADGRFGPLTEAAVERFQAAHGLAVDGIVGQQTATALSHQNVAISPGAGYGEPNGSARVRSLQKQLVRAGERPGPLDGRFGPLTEAAVERFQAAHGLAVDGIVGTATGAALAQRSLASAPAQANPRPEGPKARPEPSNTKATPTPNKDTRPAPLERATPSSSPDDSGSELPSWIAGLAGGALLALLLAGALALARRRGGALSPKRKATGAFAHAKRRGGALAHAKRKGTHALANAKRRGADAMALAKRRGTDALAHAKSSEGALGLSRGRPAWRRQAGVHIDEALLTAPLRHQSLGLVALVSELPRSRPPQIKHPDRGSRPEGGLARAPSASNGASALEPSRPEGGLASAPSASNGASALERVSVSAPQATGNGERPAVGRDNGIHRPRNGRPRRRPALADDPELVERIVQMRAQGMTLQAIADRLNAEGVPTVRGGAEWRPSSVRSGLGYRRRSALGSVVAQNGFAGKER